MLPSAAQAIAQQSEAFVEESAKASQPREARADVTNLLCGGLFPNLIIEPLFPNRSHQVTFGCRVVQIANSTGTCFFTCRTFGIADDRAQRLAESFG